MAKYLVFVIAFSVLVCTNFSLVQCADQCKTHADCKGNIWKHCCGGYFSFGSNDRTCTSRSCLYRYCSSDSDCGDPSLCCRSNKCVNKGCSGCTNNTDCYTTHVCCKKTFPLDQTVCAANCISQTCNSNDDCAGWGECCRSGKCTNSYTTCRNKCTSNSECNLDQYCCKKKKSSWAKTGCAQSCVGEICSTDEDCGPPNECCISNKCVDRGCSGCTTNSNCSTGHYCCKKKHWYELSECSAHCIGKSCNTSGDCGGPKECCVSNKCVDRDCPGCSTNSNCSTGQYCCKKTHWYELNECSGNCIGKFCKTSNDCGGPGEICDSNYRCTVFIRKTSNKIVRESSSSLPSWLIAIIIVSLVVFLIAVGMLLAVFWYVKRKRPANAIQAETVPLQNTQYRGAEIQNQQPNTQFSDLNNPTAFQNQPQHGNNNVAHQSHNPIHYPQGFQNGAQGTPNQGPLFPNPTKSPQQGNKNHEFHINPPNYDDQGHHTAMSSYPTQSNNEVTPEATQDTQYQDSSGQQMYSPNAPHQGNNYLHHPPYNPQYKGNP